MSKLEDLTGTRFGRLTVLEKGEPYITPKGVKITQWVCQCDCGNTTIVPAGRLKSGNTKSCGCYRKTFATDTRTRDISGLRFGKLTALEFAGRSISGHALWVCGCDCGNTVTVQLSNLVAGKSTSCGCYRDERTSNTHKSHGESHTRLYKVWQGMRERCYNEHHISYRFYGERGIKVCDEWNGSYEAFREWAYSSGYDKNARRGECTLDRINVNDDYCPSNCRWVPMSEQNKNRRNNLNAEQK